VSPTGMFIKIPACKRAFEAQVTSLCDSFFPGRKIMPHYFYFCIPVKGIIFKNNYVCITAEGNIL
jgi:hypothetical protein